MTWYIYIYIIYKDDDPLKKEGKEKEEQWRKERKVDAHYNDPLSSFGRKQKKKKEEENY